MLNTVILFFSQTVSPSLFLSLSLFRGLPTLFSIFAARASGRKQKKKRQLLPHRAIKEAHLARECYLQDSLAKYFLFRLFANYSLSSRFFSRKSGTLKFLKTPTLFLQELSSLAFPLTPRYLYPFSTR